MPIAMAVWAWTGTGGSPIGCWLRWHLCGEAAGMVAAEASMAAASPARAQARRRMMRLVWMLVMATSGDVGGSGRSPRPRAPTEARSPPEETCAVADCGVRDGYQRAGAWSGSAGAGHGEQPARGQDRGREQAIAEVVPSWVLGPRAARARPSRWAWSRSSAVRARFCPPLWRQLHRQLRGVVQVALSVPFHHRVQRRSSPHAACQQPAT